MAEDLLVLLLALEVEDQDLISASRIHHLAADYRALHGTDLAFLAGHGQHILELDDLTVAFWHLLNFHYVSGSYSILLAPGADDCVHKLSIAPYKRYARKDLKL